MALPVTIPNEFANATASIPLSQLDTNFNTLANAVNGISDGSETLANASVTVLTAGTANVTTLNTSGQVVFNDAGADVDFRVEGNTDANLLFVDAGNDRVGIGTNAPAGRFVVTTTATGAFANTNFRNIVIDDDTNSGMTILSGNASIGAINFGDIDGNTVGSIRYTHASDALYFNTNTAERMRISSAGEVLVGGTTEVAGGSGYLTIQQANTNAGLLLFRNDTTISAGNVLGDVSFWGNDTTSNTPTQLAYIKATASNTHAAGDNPTDLVFGVTNDGSETVYEAARFTYAGNLKFPNGQGIDFSASEGGGATSSILDDYEEGTWTPEIADATTGGNTGSVVITSPKYTKIGNLVTIQATLGNINTTGMTAANPFYCRNLPFLSSSDCEAQGSMITDLVSFQGGRTTASPRVAGSDSWVVFLAYGSGASDTTIDCGDITSGSGDIFFSITYFAA